jgi:DNA-binding HxlR family transcriptional regulator
VEYAILASLWNEPAGLAELVAAVCDRTGRSISPTVVDSHLRILEQCGFVERSDVQSPYRLAERGSVYLAQIA